MMVLWWNKTNDAKWKLNILNIFTMGSCSMAMIILGLLHAVVEILWNLLFLKFTKKKTFPTD